jgi:hypothetical protein
MNLQCAIGGHAAGPDPVYNSGYYFSPCRRCGRYLLRSARGGWGVVPPGHRIVWKAGRHSHSLEADYSGVLPIVRQGSQLPVRQAARRSNRALVRLRPAGASGAGAFAAPQAPEESGDYAYPRLLLAAVIVGAGLKMVLGSTFGR